MSIKPKLSIVPDQNNIQYVTLTRNSIRVVNM